MIQVYSNEIDGEELTFKYYDKTNDEVIGYSETLTFKNNMIVGDGFNTYGLSREKNLSQPKAYGISDAYPNPFNPVTNVSFALPENGHVLVEIFNLKGQLIDSIFNGFMYAGEYHFTWNAEDLVSGTYFLNMNAGSYHGTQKVVLIK